MVNADLSRPYRSGGFRAWTGLALMIAVAGCGGGETADAEMESAEAAPAAEEMAEADQEMSGGVVGTVWQWVGFQGMDDSSIEVEDPTLYTLELMADGQAAVRADCNRGTGGYTLDGSSLQLGEIATTRAACPPESLSDRYLSDLSYVRSFVMEDGHLFLSLMADGGIMEFRPAP